MFQCNVKAIALDAYDNARFLCDQYYLASPELEIEQFNRNYSLFCVMVVLK